MYYVIYGLFYLLSLIPLRALYWVSDGIYLLIYYGIGYRKKVVLDNLRRAFPEKTEGERIVIAKNFYRNFIDSFIEVIKLFSASESFLKKRFTVNVKGLDELYRSGRSCQFHLGHTFNWEWGHLVLAEHTPYHIVVVYMPIGSRLFERLFYRLRTRTGNSMIPASDMKKGIMPFRDSQYLLGLVCDQSPSDPANAYWLNFFGQPTPFVRGPENGARKNSLPVIFASIQKPRRGYYQAEIEIATENPQTLQPGELTVRYVRYLEKVIRANPEMWLWSHRRWKRPWKDEYASGWIDEQSLSPVAERSVSGIPANVPAR